MNEICFKSQTKHDTTQGKDKILTNAVNGKKSKRSVKVFQTLALPYLQINNKQEIILLKTRNQISLFCSLTFTLDQNFLI